MNETILDPRIQRGATIRDRATGSEGIVTRVLDTSGARGGLVEVRWTWQKRVSRTSGFVLGDTIDLAREAPAV